HRIVHRPPRPLARQRLAEAGAAAVVAGREGVCLVLNRSHDAVEAVLLGGSVPGVQAGAPARSRGCERRFPCRARLLAPYPSPSPSATPATPSKFSSNWRLNLPSSLSFSAPESRGTCRSLLAFARKRAGARRKSRERGAGLLGAGKTSSPIVRS